MDINNRFITTAVLKNKIEEGKRIERRKEIHEKGKKGR